MFVLFFLIAIYISGSLRNYDHLLLMKVFTVNKQIFHAFLFNIRNYSRETSLNIILPRVNNFNIKQKRQGIFVLLYATNTKQHLGRYRLTNFGQNTSIFFEKTELRHIKLQLLVNYFILFLLEFFSGIISPWKINRIRNFLTWNWQVIRDWRKIKQENMIHIYDITVIDVKGVQ